MNNTALHGELLEILSELRETNSKIKAFRRSIAEMPLLQEMLETEVCHLLKWRDTLRFQRKLLSAELKSKKGKQ